MAKLNDKQRQVAEVVLSTISNWKFSDDIDAPENANNIKDNLDVLMLNETSRIEKEEAIEISRAMVVLLSSIRRIK